MSNFFGSGVELVYSFGGESTNLATFTTEDNLLKTYPACAVPNLRQVLNNTGNRSSCMRLHARGLAGSTGTPTFTFTVRLITSETWSAGGLIVGSSGAVAAGSGVILSPWELSLEMILRTLPAAGVNATIKSMGSINGAAFPSEGAIPANNVSPQLSTVDLSAQYYLWISAACSASSSSNLINTQMMKLYVET